MSPRKLIKEIERRAGIQIDSWHHTGGGHLRLRLASGAVVFASATPSCSYAIHHVVGDCRRAKSHNNKEQHHAK